jgi:hypothetical protein
VVDERDLGFGRKIGWPRRRVRRKMRGKGRGGGKKIGVERVGSHIFFRCHQIWNLVDVGL